MKTDKALQRKTENFLKELDLLTEKYGMEIGGCQSCCGAGVNNWEGYSNALDDEEEEA